MKEWKLFAVHQPPYGKRVLIKKKSTGKYLVMRLTKLQGLGDDLYWISENDRFIGISASDIWTEFSEFEFLDECVECGDQFV